jgi:hypothetical protein
MTTENNTELFQKDPNHSNRSNFCKLLTTKVEKYKIDIYESQRIDFTTKKRTKHLRAREENNINHNESIGSLPPPMTRSDVSWDQYINSTKGKFPYLGREVIETIETKRISIIIGLTEEIPFDRHCLLNRIFKVLNNQVMAKISNFVRDLPKGFAVLIEYPFKRREYLKWNCAKI